MAVVIASPAQPAATFSSSTVPESSYHHHSPSLVSETAATIEEHRHNDRDHHSYRPAKNLDAFNSLLPPAVEFVEGSSTGALAVAEGKYEPINVTPKATRINGSPGEMNGKSKAVAPSSPTPTKSRIREPQQEKKKSLFNGKFNYQWPPNLNVGIGFYNQGNTCFLNSALQCLIHTPPLIRLLHDHSRTEPCVMKSGFCMSCALRKVMMDSFQRQSAFSPSPITRNLHSIAKHLRNGRQEDSHEFLRYAIDSLQKACLAGHPPKIDHKLAETTWVHKLFGGRLRSRVTCTQCGHNSDTFDSMLDLSIDIHACASLKDALRKFTAIDYLKGADKYKCEKCKRPVNAEKHFTIHDAPPVLTVHLKRFSPLGRKLAHPIRYDERLNLQPSMSEGQFGPTYQLYGVISHAGSGPNSGHYYAHVKGGSGSWYEMNDDYVEKYKGVPTNLKNAYILFYIQEKGQSLEAALNSTTSSAASSRPSTGTANGPKTTANGTVQSMKKRRVVTSDDEDEDAGEKVQSTPARFIGPQLPPEMQKATPSTVTQTQTPPSSPSMSKPYAHAEFLKKKIDAAEKSKKLTKPPPPKLPLVDYGDDDDEMDAELGMKVERLPSSASATQSSFVETFKDSPPPPPASSFPSSPISSTSTTIAPTSFYSTQSLKKSSSDTAKKRKSPDADVEMRSSDEPGSRPPLADLRQKSSGGSSSKSASSDLSHLIRSAGNPYSRLKGSDTLNNSRDEQLFKPKKLMKRQYGQKKRLII